MQSEPAFAGSASVQNPLLAASTAARASDEHSPADHAAGVSCQRNNQPSTSAAAAAAALLDWDAGALAVRQMTSFGLWCIAVLLQLSSVEPRPELWGRYVAALNPLQGVVLAAQHSAGRAASASSSARPPGGSLSDLRLSAAEAAAMQDVHKDIGALVDAAERHVRTCGSAAPKGPAAAFAAGKGNIMSVLKRYRSHVTHASAPHPTAPARSSATWQRASPPERQSPQQHQQHRGPASTPPRRSWSPGRSVQHAQQGSDDGGHGGSSAQSGGFWSRPGAPAPGHGEQRNAGRSSAQRGRWRDAPQGDGTGGSGQKDWRSRW